MSLYLYKNNQRFGPYEDARVLEMLGSGQVSPNDLGIREGDKDWQPLAKLFSDVPVAAAQTLGPAAQVPSAQTVGIAAQASSSAQAGKSGCRRFLGIFMLISGILIFSLGGLATVVSFAMGEAPICEIADDDLNKMKAAREKYESDKTEKNLNDYELAREKTGRTGKMCDEANSYYLRWKIIFILLAIGGLASAIIGFVLRR